MPAVAARQCRATPLLTARRSAAGRRRDISARTAFQPPQSRVEIDVEIALALLQLVLLVEQDFDLSAQPCDIRFQLLDLA